MKKVLLAVVGVLALAGAAVVFVVNARAGDTGTNAVPVVTGQRLTLSPGRLLFRNTAAGPDSGKLASVPLATPDAPRQVGDLRCDRFAVAAGTGVCLAVHPDVLPAVSDVIVLDDKLGVKYKESLPGTPSRARVSPDGKFVYWTLFVTGDSYAAQGFSTRAGVYEVQPGTLVKTIEELPVFVDGARYRAADVNYWGITFAPDGNRFYTTLGSKGKTYLIEGDYQRFFGKSLRDNVECPSLSPDGKRIAFKKKISEGVWRLSVLDLATMRETPLAETRSVDDQALWQDSSTILYGLAKPEGGSDIWSVPADGSGAPRLLVPDGASPAVVS
ncbi:hypothetical protein [Amycolatopsis samaneae]|uniref:WD40-like Beta Propeller Repeat n=1 Tax=Amycolatopsis samaneae TaxID=664691 RepID=A0ABW5GBC0_9PSEU